MPAIRSRISSSSSTIRTSDAICNPCLFIPRPFFLYFFLSRREAQNDFRAPYVLVRVLQRDVAAMVFHDLANDRQTQTRALGARRDIRLGQPVALFVRQANAVVRNFETHHAVVACQRNDDASRRAVTLRDARAD